MDNFFNVAQVPLPLPADNTILTRSNEQVFHGGVRILFDNGGYLLLGNCGKNSAGQTRWGMLINDGSTNRFYQGIDSGGF